MGIKVRRKAPAKKDGSQRLFLDIFLEGKRWSEMLDFKVYPSTSKTDIRIIEADAEKVASDRWVELLREKEVQQGSGLGKVRFVDYYKLVAETRSAKTCDTWKASLPAIETYAGDISIKDIDAAWLKGMQGHLATWKAMHKSKPLGHNTQHSYFSRVAATLNHAYMHDVIPTNPAGKLKKLSPEYKPRQYLTTEEIKLLEQTPLEGRQLKQAAIFNLYMGLRIGDLRNLTWKSIVHRQQEYYLEFKADKDEEMKYIPIPAPALEWLPSRGNIDDDAKIFDLYCKDEINRKLRKWAQDAGVKKDLTSHILRHTMAVQALDAGLDIMDVKEKLGHRGFKMVHHYARVSNKKMRDAAKKFPRLTWGGSNGE